MSTMRMKTPLDIEASDDPDILDIGWMRIVTTPYSRFFWEGCQKGELRIPKCNLCGNVWFYPTPRCTQCLEPAESWIAASGRATLYSFTTVHRPLHKALAKNVPYLVAVAELEEGVRMMSNLKEATEADLTLGMPLKVGFEILANGAALPYFTPASSLGGRD